MAIHSRILAWSIPWTEEPGGLQSGGGEGVTQSDRTEGTLHAHRTDCGLDPGGGVSSDGAQEPSLP